MLVSVFLALFLPCVGMSAVFLVYICLLWYAAAYQNSGATGPGQDPVKTNEQKGLNEAQLDKLPKITGKELVMGNDCAVCLDEIENEQIARIVPGCNHGFHVECADTWLSKNPICPVCRTKLEPEFFNPPESSSPC
ncbi:E3 ubiquitin-protein ligase ATL23 [Capsicum chacoense]|uniref:E3 ubiquitin-protein ligase ATL23 n=1 Tax=Capsicum annuum TaxID=4072 RepID=UPI0007BEB6F8|nr:E3 ubiquitin-protein ligase ATL23 [Capsicum annuum]KAF3628955.1 putative nucleoredoxin 2-like [Capsicum annuum]KAF3661426.1 putative nucleoredoxin 2-like [Capsicum annuum]